MFIHLNSFVSSEREVLLSWQQKVLSKSTTSTKLRYGRAGGVFLTLLKLGSMLPRPYRKTTIEFHSAVSTCLTLMYISFCAVSIMRELSVTNNNTDLDLNMNQSRGFTYTINVGL